MAKTPIRSVGRAARVGAIAIPAHGGCNSGTGFRPTSNLETIKILGDARMQDPPRPLFFSDRNRD